MLFVEKNVYPHISDNSTVHFETLGCRLNQIESEAAARFFKDKGFEISMSPVHARDKNDGTVVLCVINTCAVTAKAEQKGRRTIRLLLEKFPSSCVIVTGCYAQLNRSQIEEINERVAVLPGLLKSKLEEIPDRVKAYFKDHPDASSEGLAVYLRTSFREISEKYQKNDVSSGKKQKSVDSFSLSTDTFFSHSRSSLKIQDGCNNACTFCTIHIARGASVSLDAETVIQRVKALENSGQNEVVITTVNIAQYRGEYHGRYIGFTELLELLLTETDSIAIRLSSLYPELVDQKFCQLIKNPRVRPHFHLSVQSGSNAVLERMARHYTREKIINACNMLKEAKKNPFLACDIITGFPGETEEDFNQTVSLVKEAGFAWVHAFPFSPRPGTVACSLKPKVPESIAGQRVKILTSIAVQNKIDYINSFNGTVLEAIAETVHGAQDKKDIFHAVTENFIHTEFILPENAEVKSGDRIHVRIQKAYQDRITKGGEWDSFSTFEEF